MLSFFIPIRKEKVFTKFSKAELLKQLNHITQLGNSNQKFDDDETRFAGKINNSKFHLTTSIHDYFGPIESISHDRNGNLGNFYFNIYGNISACNKETQIDLKIVPSIFSLSVIYFLYLFIIFATFVSVWDSKSILEILLSVLQISLYYIILLYPVYLFLFKHHSKRVIKFLEKVVISK